MRPQVSVLCATYNQVDYIRDALNGFLMQHTSFPFEVLVHDDASTDGTCDILREYEERYPNRVRVIYEEENQFAKQPEMGGYFQNGLNRYARGKYIAVCEGDDYWTDPHKLQTQFDYMESHPTCVCCGHRVVAVDADSPDIVIREIGYGDQEIDVSTEQIITHFAMQTASLFYRKGYEDSYLKEWTFKKVVGDFPWLVYLSQQGVVHYLPQRMSAYRLLSRGSHSSESRRDRLLERYKETIMLHFEMGAQMEAEYADLLLIRAAPYGLLVAQLEGWKGFFCQPEGCELKKMMSARQKIRVSLLRVASCMKRALTQMVSSCR